MLRRIKLFFDQHLTLDTFEEQDSEHRIRLAVAALLLEMSDVDGEAWPEQRQAVTTAVLEHFGLEEDEAKQLLELAEAERTDSTDYFQFTSLINATYTPEQKLRIIERLWEIAYANQVLHRYEEHLVRKIADLLHIPHGLFIAAKLRASDQ